MIKSIHILPEAKAKMEAYIRNCPFEISGLGSVEERGNMLVITDVYLLEQVGSEVSTVLDPKQLSKFVVDMAMAGGDTSKLKFWWHSHVNSECYWSKTDQDCMDAFHPGDYFIATVGNKLGDSRTRLDIYKPIRTTVDDIPLISLIDSEQEKAIQAEIAAKVTKAPEIIRSKWKQGLTSPTKGGSPLGPVRTCYPVEEFKQLATEMGMTLNELLIQENMECSNGLVY